MHTIGEQLRIRGLLADSTSGTENFLLQNGLTVYNGFDPSAESLHVGHLIPLIGLMRFQRSGHTPIALIGGGTGLIGDPSGKTDERPLLKRNVVQKNVEGIRKQIHSILDLSVKSNPARIVDNSEWLLKLNAVDLLRDIGKHFSINYILSKEAVKGRINRKSISYTEFSYILLQAYDFYYLYKNYGCQLQTGGNDQWGNITAGIELIRRKTGEKAFGLVYPLLLKEDGTKLGKTEKGTIWLDPRKTSPYKFYQFWLNIDDAQVIKLLKYFTWLSIPEISDLELKMQLNPEQRLPQKKLAGIMTEMIHGVTLLKRCERASSVLFGGDVHTILREDFIDVISDVPSIEIQRNDLLNGALSMIDMLASTSLFLSKGEVKRCIREGGVYVNNERLIDEHYEILPSDLLYGEYVLVRRGKKNNFVVRCL